MKIFIAIDNSYIIPAFYKKTKIKLNIMISYHYLRGDAVKVTDEYRDMIDLLFLDSGAFSASSGKSKITVSEYLEYLKLHGRLFNAVFNFDDEFENPEHNLRNQLLLEKGLVGTRVKPIPVVHDLNDPFEEFRMYAEMGHDFIAIGSNKKLGDEVFEKIKKDYPNIKIHMFGNLNREMLLKHKPFSADSSSNVQEARTGNILYWDPIDEKEYRIYVGERDKKEGNFIHFKKFPHKSELEKFLNETFDYNYQDLLTSEEAKRVVNVYFYTQLESIINQAK